jgi:murein DD-endopeptidase MepM/ murein hydrolase activator NlpD
VLVIGVWAVNEGYRSVNQPRHTAAPISNAPVDQSALAIGVGAAHFTDGDSLRVSRSSRTDQAASSRPLDSTALPARPGLPRLDPEKTVSGTWVRPSAGAMSSCFCMRWGVMHEGIDLAGPMGSPIVAVGDGVVLEAGPAEGFGNWILIQHANGDVSLYGHMYTVLVYAGERVTAGQHIADIGADGEATGPHLHFGVMQGGKDGPYIDPVPWLRARGVDVGPYNPNA